MFLLSAGSSGAVHGLADHSVDVHRAALLRDVGALEPGEFDDVLDKRRKPCRFLVHALGEPLHRLGVVSGRLECLGQEGDRPDRCLQFVGDVRDEVVADFLGAGEFSPVIGQQEDIFLRDDGGPDLDNDRSLAERAARQLQLLFEDDAVPPHLGRQFQQLLVHHRVPADQAVGVGGGAGADHAVDRIHHHERAAEDGEHLRGALGQRGVIDVDVDNMPLLLTDPEREYAEHAKREADQAGDHADEHWIHGSSLCSAT